MCYFTRYRLAVLRALPNLEKLDDKVVSSDEVQTALAIGRSLVHPLDVDASPQSDAASPEVKLSSSLFYWRYSPSRARASRNLVFKFRVRARTYYFRWTPNHHYWLRDLTSSLIINTSFFLRGKVLFRKLGC